MTQNMVAVKKAFKISNSSTVDEGRKETFTVTKKKTQACKICIFRWHDG